MFFSDDFINEVIMANDIVDVISDYVVLKKTGRNLLGLCPFHSEKTPSFSVSAEKQFYHCFGCGVGGNIIDFIMRIERLDFVEAMRALADRAHIDLPQEKTSGSVVSEKDVFYDMNRQAALFFHEQLAKSDAAKTYFQNRKLNETTITHFGLGYAPDSWDSLHRHMQTLGFSDELLYRAGLLGKKENHYYDSFRNRVMFPILDLRGRVIGFGGRVLDDSKPKYLNSPESPVFTKSNHLYGLNFAKQYTEKKLLMVEGYMDVIALHQAGFPYAVAALGTAFTQEHSKILKRYAQEVILCFDSDQAGQTATKRCLDLLKDQEVHVAVLEDAKDPDEYIQRFGRDAFLRLLKEAPSQTEYLIRQLRKQFDLEQIDQKIAFVREAANLFLTLQSDVERELYVKKTAMDTGVSAEAIFSEIQKKSPRKRKPILSAETKEQPPSYSQSSFIKQEEMLLSLVYEEPSFYAIVKERGGENFFTVKEHQDLFRLFGTHSDLSVVFQTLSESQRTLISRLTVQDWHVKNKKHALEQLLTTIEHQLQTASMKQQKETDDAEKLHQLLLQDHRSKHVSGKEERNVQ